MASWKEDELEDFKIDVKKMAHVYDVHYFTNEDGSSFEVLVHIKYRNSWVFVFLVADCCEHGLECKMHPKGYLYIYKHPNQLIKEIEDLPPQKIQEIHRSLHQDGYRIDIHDDFKSLIPTLKNVGDKDDLIISALGYQDRFEVRTEPSKKDPWK